MIARDKFGQLEPGVITAAEAPAAFSLPKYFFVAVAAGVTVWMVTRWLDSRRR